MAFEQSREVRTILAQAAVVARETRRTLSSVHYLVATFLVECQARELLVEAAVDDGKVLDTFEKMAEREDPPDALAEILRSAEQLAESSNSPEVTSTLLLAGMLRVRQSLAWKVLDRSGVNVPGLRARAIGQVTLSNDRASSTGMRPAVRGPADEPRALRTGTTSVDAGRFDLPRSTTRTDLPVAEPVAERVDLLRARPLPADRMLANGPQLDRAADAQRERISETQRERISETQRERISETQRRLGTLEPADGGRGAEAEARRRSYQIPMERVAREPDRLPDARPDRVPDPRIDARTSDNRASESRSDTRAPGPRTEAHSNRMTEPPGQDTLGSEPPRRTEPRLSDLRTGPASRVFELTPELYPTLLEIGRNLTRAALHGEIEPLIGRETIVDAVIDILLMKQANNPCLIGEAGVGKTAIAEGLALKLAGNVEQYGRLGSAVLIEIHTSALLAGTALRGAFSERMRKLRDEVARADGQVVVFMDEIHTIMGAGTGDGPLDAANDLKSALARGRFPLIGATTRAEYERHIEKDPAMERRFQVVPVPEPTVPEAIAILSGIAPSYSRHHGVRYSHDAIVSAVHLSKRFITDRCLPDKAVAVLDRAGAQARRANRTQVQVDDVARAVHMLTSVPMDRLLADERGRIRDLAADLQARIIGHDVAMQRVARRIQRNYAGFCGDRPLASFRFVGAPGVGKTETARALSEALFVTPDALVRFDMNDYAESHSLARLIGSPPGYVGHAQVGLLSQALQKRPYRVLLFDEVDRAAPEVLALLLQLLDSGRITDHHGQTVDVRNCILVLTSNLGGDLLAAGSPKRSIGFGSFDSPLPEGPQSGPLRPTLRDPMDQAVLDQARAGLPVELWGRIDDAVVFRPLGPAAAREIVVRTLASSARQLYEARCIRFEVDTAVIDLVLEGGVDPSQGARPLRARVESIVEAFVTDCILDGALQPGAEAHLTVRDGHLALR